MIAAPAVLSTLKSAVNPQRLLDTATSLIAIPSRTGDAGAVLDHLADLLRREGFAVERAAAGHPKAPAVAARFSTGKPGRTLQFNGHLDTVHLPFVPPRIEGDLLRGSGSADMKGGVAAAVEALRVLRQTGLLPGGGILLTAHDLHESPWGDGSQLDRMIAEGITGDAVLLPEYLHDQLPVVGRGGLTWRVVIRRPGSPIHEVMRPNEPSVIAAGGELIVRVGRLHETVAQRKHPMAGSESVFIGQVHSGEIFNQYPQECLVEGTRRWLPGTRRVDVEKQLHGLFDQLAIDTQTQVDRKLTLMRDAFELKQDDVVAAFQDAHQVIAGAPLPTGAKPFCDDGNSYWALARIAAITHGPRAGGAHTLDEWASIRDLVRVALVYAATAVAYCGAAG